MKAAILREFGSALEIDDIVIGDPEPHEVLISVVASGVCHTDRTIQTGPGVIPLPLVLGHEVAGVVQAVGSEVTYVAPGDHVTVCASSFCGSCRWCLRGAIQHCENKHRARPPADTPRLRTTAGAEVTQFVGISGFAEQVLVHESAVVKLPPEIPLDRACLLGCAVITGVGAIRHGAKVRSGDTVAVIGCGGVGLNAIQGARLVGASRIIAIDRRAEKLEMALAFGATDVIDASQTDPVAAVWELTGRGLDHVIEVVGIAQTMEQGFAMLDTMGTLTVVGVARPDVELRITASELLLEKRVQGVKMGSARPRLDIPLYAEMYLAGRLELDALISHRIPLTEVNAGLADLDDPSGARTILTF